MPRRALVAAATAVAGVGGLLGITASPAHALTFISTRTLSQPGVGSVTVTLSYGLNTEVYEDVVVTNSLGDSNTCVEGWADVYLPDHRPANGFPNCIKGTYDSGALPIHWPRSAANPGGSIYVNDLTQDNIKLALCQVWTPASTASPYRVHFARDNIFCAQGTSPNGPVGAITNQSYSTMSWQDEQNITCNNCTADMRPEYTNHGRIDILNGPSNDALYPGDMLVSFDGSHRLVQQGDGNLVLYSGNTPTWAVTNCMTAGHFINSGSHTVMQSDGNFVYYSPNGSGFTAQWASANMNAVPPCHPGAFQSASPWMILWAAGDLVEYYSGSSVAWDTGTWNL